MRRLRLQPQVKTGPKACPFNILYWAFLIDHAEILSGNHRLAMPYRTIARWGEARCRDISRAAHEFLDRLPTDYD